MQTKIQYIKSQIFIFTFFIFVSNFYVVGFALTQQSNHFKMVHLAEGVYAAIHSIGGQAICNAGVVNLGNKTIIFDTFLSLNAAKDLKNISESITLNPVEFVINSHAHNDHIRGNQVFKPFSTILGTKTTRYDIAENEPNNLKQEADYAPKQLASFEKKLQVEKDESKKREIQMWVDYFQALVESHSSQEVTLPDSIFQNQLTLHSKNRTVELIEHSGHTKSDLIMYLPEDNIVFTGDLVFIGSHPYLADGNPAELLSSLNKLIELDIEKVVPGHGPVGTKDDIFVMIDYIQMIQKVTMNLAENGKSIQEVSNVKIPEPFNSWNFPNFFRTNLKFMYKLVLKDVNQKINNTN